MDNEQIMKILNIQMKECTNIINANYSENVISNGTLEETLNDIILKMGKCIIDYRWGLGEKELTWLILLTELSSSMKKLNIKTDAINESTKLIKDKIDVRCKHTWDWYLSNIDNHFKEAESLSYLEKCVNVYKKLLNGLKDGTISLVDSRIRKIFEHRARILQLTIWDSIIDPNSKFKNFQEETYSKLDEYIIKSEIAISSIYIHNKMNEYEKLPYEYIELDQCHSILQKFCIKAYDFHILDEDKNFYIKYIDRCIGALAGHRYRKIDNGDGKYISLLIMLLYIRKHCLPEKVQKIDTEEFSYLVNDLDTVPIGRLQNKNK